MFKGSAESAKHSTSAARIVSLFIGLLLCALPVHAADNEKPVGKNCGLTSPPAAAGEEISHGIVLRVYPRAKDIDARYSGCQVLFAPHGQQWIGISLTEVISGDAVRVWSDDYMDIAVRACRFKQGKLIQGDPGTCPSPEFILVKSLVPGCARIIQDAIARNGPGATWPSSCKYD